MVSFSCPKENGSADNCLQFGAFLLLGGRGGDLFGFVSPFLVPNPSPIPILLA